MIGALAASEAPWIRGPFINLFQKAYGVNLAEAARTATTDYASFNDFFTRELAEGARPLSGGAETAICPADGAVSQAGPIRDGALLQAKGHTYSAASLLGSHQDAAPFDGGLFATVYLAPKDYHRVHLPVAGRLEWTRSIPGALFSVNAVTEANIDGLFARNERLVCQFSTDWGPMAVVLVGAMIVAGIDTVWDGPSSPYSDVVQTRHGDIEFDRGAEIGRFFLGSTVIVCLPPGAAELAPDIRAGRTVRMGQALFLRGASDAP
jgi:phosphatidylserine decarboxylase